MSTDYGKYDITTKNALYALEDLAGEREKRQLKYFCTLRFEKYDRPKPFSTAAFVPYRKYILPLPQTLNDATVSNWSGANLDVIGDIVNGSPIGAAASGAYRNVGAGINIVGQTIGNKFDKAAQDLAQSAGFKAGRGSSFLKGAVNAVLPPETIQNAVEASVGVAPNPNPTLLFKGPELRQYEFRWIFYPKNEDESKSIHKMIRDIKQMMLPDNVILDSASLLSYPHMCVINFYPWDGMGNPIVTSPGLFHTDESIIIIKRAAVTSCNVNYTPGTTPSFFAGTSKPTIIEMVLVLKELEYVMANDWGAPSLAQGAAEALISLDNNVSSLFGSDAVAAPPDSQPGPDGTKQQ